MDEVGEDILEGVMEGEVRMDREEVLGLMVTGEGFLWGRYRRQLMVALWLTE